MCRQGLFTRVRRVGGLSSASRRSRSLVAANTAARFCCCLKNPNQSFCCLATIAAYEDWLYSSSAALVVNPSAASRRNQWADPGGEVLDTDLGQVNCTRLY